jgi:hypothetical protein
MRMYAINDLAWPLPNKAIRGFQAKIRQQFVVNRKDLPFLIQNHKVPVNGLLDSLEERAISNITDSLFQFSLTGTLSWCKISSHVPLFIIT